MKLLSLVLTLILSVMLVAGCATTPVDIPEDNQGGQDNTDENGSDSGETNTGPVPEDFIGKHVVVLVSPYATTTNQGINQYEFEALYNGFKSRTHATVTAVTTSSSGVEGLEDRNGSLVEVQNLLEMDPKDIDAIFIVGGGGTRHYYECEKTMNYFKEFAKLGKPMGGVCSGVPLLSASGLLEGKEVTTDEFYKAQVEEFGAIYIARENVVNDGQFWTIKGGAEALFFRNFLPVLAEVQ